MAHSPIKIPTRQGISVQVALAPTPVVAAVVRMSTPEDRTTLLVRVPLEAMAVVETDTGLGKDLTVLRVRSTVKSLGIRTIPDPVARQ